MGEEISTNTNSLFENRFPEYESIIISCSTTVLSKEILYVSILDVKQNPIKEIMVIFFLIRILLIKKAQYNYTGLFISKFIIIVNLKAPSSKRLNIP